jgi:hypothetical protein
VGFVVNKVALGQVFSEYFGFPCQFSFHLLLHIHHHLSSGAGTIGQTVADVPSGLNLTTPQETKTKKKKTFFLLLVFIVSHSTLAIKAVRSSDISVNSYQTIPRHVKEDSILLIRHRENPKRHIIY